MRDTTYTDASGIASATTSTAADQLKLAREAMRNPVLRDIVATRETTVPGGPVANTNTLLGTSGVVGLKTGSSTPAGGNLLWAAETDGTHLLLGAVLHQRANTTPAEGLTAALEASRTLIDGLRARLRSAGSELTDDDDCHDSGPGEAPRGTLTTTCAVLLAAVLARPELIPTAPGHLGSLTDTLLPGRSWPSRPCSRPPCCAAPRRLGSGGPALVLWLTAFGGTLTDKSAPDGDLTVVSHNVNQDNPDPQGTARGLLAAHADILALEELSPETAPAYERALAPRTATTSTKGRSASGACIRCTTHAACRSCRGPGPCAPRPTHPTAPDGLRRPPPVGTGDPTAGFDSRPRRGTAPPHEPHPGGERPSLPAAGRLQRHRRRPRPAPAHLPLHLGTGDGGRGLGSPGRPASRWSGSTRSSSRGTATSAWTLPATRSDHLPVAATITF